jgi:hypothetical protein
MPSSKRFARFPKESGVIRTNCNSPDSIAQILLKTEVKVVTKEEHRLKNAKSNVT